MYYVEELNMAEPSIRESEKEQLIILSLTIEGLLFYFYCTIDDPGRELVKRIEDLTSDA
jgi:hypothetical protein